MEYKRYTRKLKDLMEEVEEKKKILTTAMIFHSNGI